MTSKLATIALAALVLVAGFGTVTAAAGASTSQDDGTDEVRIVDEEATISDALITVSDTTITGPFDSDHHIDEQTYTVDSTVGIDGLHFTHDGTEYTVCQIDIHVEDVGLHVENVTLESTQ